MITQKELNELEAKAFLVLQAAREASTDRERCESTLEMLEGKEQSLTLRAQEIAQEYVKQLNIWRCLS